MANYKNITQAEALKHIILRAHFLSVLTFDCSLPLCSGRQFNKYNCSFTDFDFTAGRQTDNLAVSYDARFSPRRTATARAAMDIPKPKSAPQPPSVRAASTAATVASSRGPGTLEPVAPAFYPCARPARPAARGVRRSTPTSVLAISHLVHARPRWQTAARKPNVCGSTWSCQDSTKATGGGRRILSEPRRMQP